MHRAGARARCMHPCMDRLHGRVPWCAREPAAVTRLMHQDAATGRSTGTEIDPFRKSIHRIELHVSTRKNAPKRDSRALVCGARCTPGALVRPCGPAVWGPHMGRPCGVAMWRFLRKKRHIAAHDAKGQEAPDQDGSSCLQRGSRSVLHVTDCNPTQAR